MEQDPKESEVVPPTISEEVAVTSEQTPVKTDEPQSVPAAEAKMAPVPAPNSIASSATVPQPSIPKAEAEPTSSTPPPKPISVQEIIVEALDKVDIRIQIADGKTENISLEPERIHTIKAKGKIALDISDGGMVNIIHNGRDQGVPGDLGKPKKITFP